jgi:small subunit ribosomal protein S3
MRRLITGRLRNAGLARIETERSANQLTIIIQTAKPGIVIGKQGASVDALRDELERISGKKVRVTIHEIKSPEVDAKLVAESVASQLEKRIAFRRAIKQSIMRTMRAGARGVKIQVSGRLGGSEMSRREWDRDGRVPLHTLRANIDYGQAEARTTFGRIGVTVWIYKGDFVTATGEPVLPPGDGRSREEGGDGAPERTRRGPAARAESAAPRPEGRAPAPAAGPAAVAPPAAAEPAAAPAPAEVEAEPEPEAAAVVEVEEDLDTDVTPDVLADVLPDELGDVDISGVRIPDLDTVVPGPEAGPKRAPARRKPTAPRKPGPAKAREPEPEVEEE